MPQVTLRAEYVQYSHMYTDRSSVYNTTFNALFGRANVLESAQIVAPPHGYNAGTVACRHCWRGKTVDQHNN